jgi:hypothetical protein
VVDQNAAHRLGPDGKEVRATLPIDTALVNQAHKGFVNERCGL